MAVDGDTPLTRVTPASGSPAVRPVGEREGRQGRAQPENEEEEPRDLVELSGEEPKESETAANATAEETPSNEPEEEPAEPSRLDLRV